MRVFIDWPLLTYSFADLLIISAPTLALYGVLWHIRPEQHASSLKGFVLTCAFALVLLSPYLELSQIFTSLVVTSVFAVTSYQLHKARANSNIYILILGALFALHSVLMLMQTSYLISMYDQGTTVQSSYVLHIILTIHLVLSTCTAMVFPMLYFVRSEETLINLANFDALTNLYNRRAFFTFGEQRINECIEKQHPIAVMMIDVDFFKLVNDQYGHDAGDAALKWVSKNIAQQVRSSDIAARIGGEEFAVLLANTDHETAIRVGQRLRTSICDNTFHWRGDTIALSISIGVNCQPFAKGDIKHMLMQADKGLYIAKQNGRNRLVESSDAQTRVALS
ncbi:GGDEF domain-containing protein [Pseudoalteromonas sp. SSDWG2]|uniref:GGDEF domain-containing protein n=1 Tax=Pseudoalteromonas sp. SSDWG2 TaxID=3139391 RepID=UPI003BAB2CBC